jgi:hypothetical protein
VSPIDCKYILDETLVKGYMRKESAGEKDWERGKNGW